MEDTRGFKTNKFSKKIWTTLSVELPLKDKIEKAVIEHAHTQGKRISYNKMLDIILDEWIAKKS
jgi:hypothetical protein